MDAVIQILQAVPDLFKKEAAFVQQAVSSACFLTEHEWAKVVGKAIDLVEIVIGFAGENSLKQSLQLDTEIPGLFGEPKCNIRQLVSSLCKKLTELTENDAELSQKILSLMLKLAPAVAEIATDFESDENLDLIWICKEVRNIFNSTTAEDTQNLILKRQIYLWIGSLVLLVEPAKLVKVGQLVLAPAIKDMLENEDQFKEETRTIWSNLQNRFENEPTLWTKIQNIYNALKLGIDKRNKKVENKKRKASEFRMKVKKPKLSN